MIAPVSSWRGPFQGGSYDGLLQRCLEYVEVVCKEAIEVVAPRLSRNKLAPAGACVPK